MNIYSNINNSLILQWHVQFDNIFIFKFFPFHSQPYKCNPLISCKIVAPDYRLIVTIVVMMMMMVMVMMMMMVMTMMTVLMMMMMTVMHLLLETKLPDCDLSPPKLPSALNAHCVTEILRSQQ